MRHLLERLDTHEAWQASAGFESARDAPAELDSKPDTNHIARA